MELLPADYVLLGLTGVMALMGLFRGFSGTLAFFLASAAAAVAGPMLWTYSATVSDQVWVRGLGVGLATLLMFGLVRLIVKKCVNGLLSQPSDAIFGFLVGIAFGIAVVAVWGYAGVYLEHSNLATTAAGYLKGNLP